MKKDIFSHTETDATFPGFFILSEEDNGSYTLIARSKRGGIAAVVSCDQATIEEMAKSVLAHCEGNKVTKEKKKK